MQGAYPPPHYNEPNLEAQLQLIRKQPLATFIIADGNTPLATPLPLVLAKADILPDGKLWTGSAGSSPTENQQLLGHLDANNPAADLIQNGREALAIFHGPNTYISPTDYTTKQLPTYNYQQVFVQGTLIRHTNHADVQADIHALVHAMEPEGNWDLSPDDPRIAALIGQVVGFRLVISSITGRFKLSQDKKAADQAAVLRKMGK